MPVSGTFHQGKATGCNHVKVPGWGSIVCKDTATVKTTNEWCVSRTTTGGGVLFWPVASLLSTSLSTASTSTSPSWRCKTVPAASSTLATPSSSSLPSSCSPVSGHLCYYLLTHQWQVAFITICSVLMYRWSCSVPSCLLGGSRLCRHHPNHWWVVFLAKPLSFCLFAHS